MLPQSTKMLPLLRSRITSLVFMVFGNGPSYQKTLFNVAFIRRTRTCISSCSLKERQRTHFTQPTKLPSMVVGLHRIWTSWLRSSFCYQSNLRFWFRNMKGFIQTKHLIFYSLFESFFVILWMSWNLNDFSFFRLFLGVSCQTLSRNNTLNIQTMCYADKTPRNRKITISLFRKLKILWQN